VANAQSVMSWMYAGIYRLYLSHDLGFPARDDGDTLCFLGVLSNSRFEMLKDGAIRRRIRRMHGWWCSWTDLFLGVTPACPLTSCLSLGHFVKQFDPPLTARKLFFAAVLRVYRDRNQTILTKIIYFLKFGNK
jgi:hypothetical protein